MKRFEGKIALITGGANGLGETLARRLVSEGAKVIIADIEADTLKTVCDSMPGDAFGIVCDVSNKASVDAMVAEAVEHWGRIDILFNNARIGIFKNFLELTEEDWRRVIDVNLTGQFLVGQAVAKAMIRTETRGVIVNTSSNTQFRVTPFSGAYGPSKGGVGQLTRIMSLELFPHGIRVNAVAPGSAMTRITEATRNNTEKYKRMLAKYSAGRFATPEEVTSVMLFLASDDASYVHGESYVVDSGYITN